MTSPLTRVDNKGAVYHQSFVHEELFARGAVIVLGVDGKAQEEDVHHDLKDGQEAVSDQEGEETHDGERQQPLGVIPLVIQKHDTGERRRCHDQDLQKAANTKKLSEWEVCSVTQLCSRPRPHPHLPQEQHEVSHGVDGCYTQSVLY